MSNVCMIYLNTIDKLKNAITAANMSKYEFEVNQGRWVIPLRSLLGMMSLDLSKPIVVYIHCPDDCLFDESKRLDPWKV